jgi:apolipoprotein N-acyltransferase
MSENRAINSNINLGSPIKELAPKGLWNTLKNILARHQAWVWLLVGFMLLPFTAWQTVIPLAAWLAPVFILRFERTCSRPRLVIPLIFAAYAAALLIDLRNGHGDLWAWIFGILMLPVARGLLYLLPYIADRRIGAHLGPWGRLMVFPMAFTTVDWAMSLLPSVTTAGSPAYSQYGNLPLEQILSVTGMWGLTFLIAWFASTANALWEQSFNWRPVRGMLALFTGVLVAVFLYGGLRLGITRGQLSDASVPTVKAATVTNETIFDVLNSMNLTNFNQASDAERAAIRPQFTAVNHVLLARMESALQAGAKIVATQETAGLVLEEDKSQLLEQVATLAQKYNAYIDISLWIFTRTPALPYIHNQSVLVDPAGQVEWAYDKSYPVAGGENFIVFRGSGLLPVVDTPYGRLSTAICNDLHFPALLRQASQNNVDILIAPFDDDPSIDTQDPSEAANRTIENGFSLVRAAGRGLSTISDPVGQLLGSQDYFTTDTHVMLATLPIQAEKTIYGYIGDGFAYACVAGLLAFTVWAILQRKQR